MVVVLGADVVSLVVLVGFSFSVVVVSDVEFSVTVAVALPSLDLVRVPLVDSTVSFPFFVAVLSVDDSFSVDLGFTPFATVISSFVGCSVGGVGVEETESVLVDASTTFSVMVVVAVVLVLVLVVVVALPVAAVVVVVVAVPVAVAFDSSKNLKMSL